MRIYLSPQVKNERINYSFKGEVVEIEMDNAKDTFDFTGLPNGKILLQNEAGDELMKTKLPLNPLIYAYKEKDVLYLELLNYIPEDASYEERFPEWIDAKDYVQPIEEVESDEDEGIMEE